MKSLDMYNSMKSLETLPSSLEIRDKIVLIVLIKYRIKNVAQNDHHHEILC